MNDTPRKKTVLLVISAVVIAGVGAGAGYWLATRGSHTRDSRQQAAPLATAVDRQPLYWYDPMNPGQHFDRPGKSPFMDMQLIPRYADEGEQEGGVKIDPAVLQNLGVRLTKVEQGPLSQSVDALGSIAFNERNVAIVQARAAGFVARVYARAPGDVIPRNAPLVDLLIPEWAGAQSEFLALLRSGDGPLIEAARQRLLLLGISAESIASIEASHGQRATVTIRAPLGGVIESLEVREGMAVAPGATLARITGLATVWLEAALPEAQAALAPVGQKVEVWLNAYPGQQFVGRVIGVLPEANVETRTLRARIELANPDGRLRPGMFAQVRLRSGDPAPKLYVASESIIHTGTRTVVLVAEKHGRFIPTEVRIGADIDGKTVILQGLSPGQQVVASGQFLIDSEASLKGALARLAGTSVSGSER